MTASLGRVGSWVGVGQCFGVRSRHGANEKLPRPAFLLTKLLSPCPALPALPALPACLPYLPVCLT